MDPLFFPRSDALPVLFYDNNKCGFKEAYRVLRGGQVERALELSEANLAECLSKKRMRDKFRANAHHNVGIALGLLGDYERAFSYLHESRSLRPGSVADQAIRNLQKAQTAAEEKQRYDEEIESISAAWDALVEERRAGTPSN